MTATVPKIGDVLQHPIFGVFRVREIDADRVMVERAEQVFAIPMSVIQSAQPAKGLMSQGAIDPQGLRRLVLEDPLGVLAELMEEVECTRADTGAWFTGLGVLSEAEFDKWWEALGQQIEEDGRFSQIGEVIRWRESPIVELGKEQVAREPLPEPGGLSAEDAFFFAEAVAAGLALAHVQGVCVVRLRSAVEIYGEEVHFRPLPMDAPGGSKADVRFAMRLILEQILGPLPAEIKEEEVPFLVLGVNRNLPPELLAVAIEVFSEAGLADGEVFRQRLGVAAAVAHMRADAPWNTHSSIKVGFDTHIGLTKSLMSQTNQDCFLLVGDPELALLVVADGISLCTIGSGDKASSLAMRSMRQSWGVSGEGLRGTSSARLHNFLENSLRKANESVCDGSMRLAEGGIEGHAPMGTTVVAALMAGNRVHLGALGDSRAYLVGAHGVAPLTYDQNLKAMQLRMYMGGRKVEWGEQGHALVGFLGHFDSTARPALPNVFQKTVPLLPGEWLILCSDGFSDYAGADEGAVAMVIRRAIQEAMSAPEGNVPMEVARALVLAANRGGGGDNITVLAITLSAEQPATNEEKPIASSGEEADATQHYT